MLAIFEQNDCVGADGMILTGDREGKVPHFHFASVVSIEQKDLWNLQRATEKGARLNFAGGWAEPLV